jgi:hypothetical protein
LVRYWSENYTKPKEEASGRQNTDTEESRAEPQHYGSLRSPSCCGSANSVNHVVSTSVSDVVRTFNCPPYPSQRPFLPCGKNSCFQPAGKFASPPVVASRALKLANSVAQFVLETQLQAHGQGSGARKFVVKV